MDLVLTGPPKNDPWKSGRSGADHDTLITDDMAAMVMLYTQLMKFGSDRHVFCYDVQFSKRIRVMQGALSKNQEVRKRDFVVEQKSMVYVQNKTS